MYFLFVVLKNPNIDGLIEMMGMYYVVCTHEGGKSKVCKIEFLLFKSNPFETIFISDLVRKKLWLTSLILSIEPRNIYEL